MYHNEIKTMETTSSLEIIGQMIQESKRSLYKNSFYFILWGILISLTGIVEYFFRSNPNAWLVWPLIGIIGGIVSGIYDKKESEDKLNTSGDRIMNYTWTGFGICLVFVIFYAILHGQNSHPLILLIAAFATFISGGVSKFKPFVYGSILLFAGAIVCTLLHDFKYLSLIFSLTILAGFFIPGLLLRSSENG